MRRIEKGPEPRSLLTYRASTPGADYSGLPTETKAEMREQLLQEQGGLCCYCQRRIHDRTLRIEHARPQSKHPERVLDWSNLFASCDTPNTCDPAKGATELEALIPSEVVEARFRYQSTGHIRHEFAQHDLEVLNLNEPRLKRARQQQLKRDIEIFKRRYHRFTTRNFERAIADWSTGTRPPYSGQFVWWLRKKLRQQT